MTRKSIGMAWFDGVGMVCYGTLGMSWLGVLNANKVEVTPGQSYRDISECCDKRVIMSDGMQDTKAGDNLV